MRGLSRTIDHLVSMSKGGHKTDFDNLVLCCGWCNQRKGDNSVEWLFADSRFRERQRWSRKQRGIAPNGMGYWHKGMQRVYVPGWHERWHEQYCRWCDWQWETYNDSLRNRCAWYSDQDIRGLGKLLDREGGRD